MQDWQKFWKGFCRCFVFQSRISTKTVVTSSKSWRDTQVIPSAFALAIWSWIILVNRQITKTQASALFSSSFATLNTSIQLLVCHVDFQLLVQFDWQAPVKLNGLVQDMCKWLFRVNFFSLKSAWIFACSFQLRSKTFPCIFSGWFALCNWEKRSQNIEAYTMNALQSGTRAFQAKKRYRRMFFY